jgi:hypothetical protein
MAPEFSCDCTNVVRCRCTAGGFRQIWHFEEANGSREADLAKVMIQISDLGHNRGVMALPVGVAAATLDKLA